MRAAPVENLRLYDLTYGPDCVGLGQGPRLEDFERSTILYAMSCRIRWRNAAYPQGNQKFQAEGRLQ